MRRSIEQFVMRLVLVDNYCRWIVGDTAVFAADSEEWRTAVSVYNGEPQRLGLLAARLLDEQIGEVGWSYHFSKDPTPCFPVGYLVYRVKRAQMVPAYCAQEKQVWKLCLCRIRLLGR